SPLMRRYCAIMGVSWASADIRRNDRRMEKGNRTNFVHNANLILEIDLSAGEFYQGRNDGDDRAAERRKESSPRRQAVGMDFETHKLRMQRQNVSFALAGAYYYDGCHRGLLSDTA